MKTCILFLCVVAVLWAEANANCPPLENPQGQHTVKEGTIICKDNGEYICNSAAYFYKSCAEYHVPQGVEVTHRPKSPSECCPSQ